MSDSPKDIQGVEEAKKSFASPNLLDDVTEEMEVDLVSISEKAECSVQAPLPMQIKSPVRWRGTSMAEIYQGDSPWCVPEFPLVVPSSRHAVLYHISNSGFSIGRSPPSPQIGEDKWDKDFVRMPYSNMSKYPVELENGETVLEKRWSMIKDALSQPINNCHDLHLAILKYNSKYKDIWKFPALHKLFNKYLEKKETEFFFKSTLPAMIKLALKLPQLLPSSIPLLRQHSTKSVSLSQEQISCLLANAFFCTFPRRNTDKMRSEYNSYPNINFFRLYGIASKSNMEKLKCICNYFRRVCKQAPCGVMTFKRRSADSSECPEWSDSKKLLGSILLHISSKGTIEDDGLGLLQVDFANKFLGGGVLGGGCVQEEIRFVICPELLVSMLFTEVLKPTEALLMIGCERFNDYKGYSNTFEWSGNYEDSTPFDSSGRRKCAIIAIDALPFRDSKHQYRPELITRELNKAWTGYSVCTDPSTESDLSNLNLPGVATGNWGCGAYRGSPHLKALIQLMACCETRRPMVYYTFGDPGLREDVINMYNFLSKQNITVGELYEYLCQFHKANVSQDQLYSFILQHQKDVQKKMDPKPANLSKELNVANKPKIHSVIETAETGECSKTNTKHLSNTSLDDVIMYETDETKEYNYISEITKLLSPVDAVKDTKHERKPSNTSMFERFTIFDELNSKISKPLEGTPKKHGTISCFDTVENPQVNSKESKNENMESNQEMQKNRNSKTPSGKIYDYFQKAPKK